MGSPEPGRTPTRMGKQSRALSALTLCLMTLTSSGFSRPDAPLPSRSSTAPLGAHQAEVVFGAVCGITLTPEKGFEVHVPLNNDGSQDNAHSYATGKVKFDVKLPSCGQVTVHKGN